MMEAEAAAATESCRDGKNWCYFHPNQLVIGVCAFCLNQRLLILAASDEQQNGSHSHSHRRRRRRRKTVPHIHLPKIFALTNYSFLKQRKTQDQQSSFTHSSSPSTQEESFISIKFEENGAVSWEKSTTMASMEKYCEMTSWNQNDIKLKKKKKEEEGVVRGAVVVVEPRGGGGGGASSSLRWRKRIGHLFQLMKWKKSSSSAAEAMGNVGTKLEGHVKVRQGWIRTLTKKNNKNNNNKAGGLMSTENRNRCS